MKKSGLWIITGLMSLALIGVCVLQWYYISQAYLLRSQIFTQNVNKALNSVADQVQRINALQHIEGKENEVARQNESNIRSRTDKIVNFREQFKTSEEQRKFSQQQLRFEYLNFQDNNIRQSYITPIIITENEFQRYNNTDANIIDGLDLLVVSTLENGSVERRLVPKFPRPNLQWLFINNQLPDTVRYIALSSTDQLPRLISLPSTDADLESKFLIEDANYKHKFKLELERMYADTIQLDNRNKNLLEDIQKEIQTLDVPLTERISQKKIDSLLNVEFLNQGIKTNFQFWVTMARKDSVIYKQISTPINETNPENIHKVLLFSKDIVRDPGMLHVYFPNQKRALLSEMKFNLGSSVAFVLLLLIIFTYTIYSIIKQKKISEMKSDFINNMTHEFKTPVATIMLASEGLKDPSIANDKNRIQRLANIIYDENVRLGDHIERVLNVARIEKKEVNFDFQNVDLHEVISAVTESMSLQLQKRNTNLKLNLNATNSWLYCDELHLSNVLFNLIDNAIKYSKDNPYIEIRTRNSRNNLILEVIDKGIGITGEQTKRIFDQFYRVPTGNLHDVKGFGLGLNYVQDIVKEMNGTIKVKSEIDKGTTFELTFPIIKV